MSGHSVFKQTWLVLVTALLLSACGGSADNDSPPDADSSPSALESSADKSAQAATDGALTWSACSAQGQICNFTGTQRVRYGLGDKWVERVMTAPVKCDNDVFVNPLPGVTKVCQTQPIRWTFCAKEGGSCDPTGTELVRYGAADKWVIREFANITACTNAVFGDPIVGTVKSCEKAPLKGSTGTPPPDPVIANAWSNPATWGGTVPPAGATVVIPAGKTVLLDTKVKVKGLTVNGTLACGGNDIAIEADWVMVSGSQAKLACGTQAQPYKGKFNLALVGPRTDNIMGMGARVFGGMSGATIEMFGEPRTGWTKLDATALKGSTTLALADTPTNWRAGMDIVIGSSSENPREAEVRRIQSINGKSVTLSSALTFDHFGQRQSYSGGGKTYVADTRAPVGLLSRNITIEGGGDSAATQFGGHMMTMVSAKVYVSDVGFNRMGQKGLLGRYPIHWHLAGDVRGQFVNNSSIWESYNRCVTIHGTDNAWVEGNVCYNHLGHGYFMEDGTEQGNTLVNNLGVLTVRPKAGEAVLESDREVANASIGPAAFWVPNPNNTLIGNQAAGSDGSGFWYSLDDRQIVREGSPSVSINPRKTDLLKFENNIASGMPMGFSTCQKGGEVGFEPPNESTWENLTVFMTSDTGIWPCGLRRQIFESPRVLDSGRLSQDAAFTAPTPMTLKDALFVANSALSGLNGRSKVGRAAIGFYDQGFHLQNAHFVGYTKADNSSLLTHVGGAVKKTWNYAEGVTFSPAQFAVWNNNQGAGDSDGKTGSVIYDIDGSFGAGPGTSLLPKAPIFEGAECANPGNMEANTFGQLCPTRIVRARFVFPDSVRFDGYTLFRSGSSGFAEQRFDGTRDAPAPSYIQPFATLGQSVQAYYYGVRFDTNPGSDFSILFQGMWPNDKLRYEVRGLGANASVTNSSFKQAMSASEFNSLTGSVWYRAGTTLHIKATAPATGKQWSTNLTVNINP
jgi:G8 domain